MKVVMELKAYEAVVAFDFQVLLIRRDQAKSSQFFASREVASEFEAHEVVELGSPRPSDWHCFQATKSARALIHRVADFCAGLVAKAQRVEFDSPVPSDRRCSESWLATE